MEIELAGWYIKKRSVGVKIHKRIAPKTDYFEALSHASLQILPLIVYDCGNPAFF